jgi:hypothetical protein
VGRERRLVGTIPADWLLAGNKSSPDSHVCEWHTLFVGAVDDLVINVRDVHDHHHAEAEMVAHDAAKHIEADIGSAITRSQHHTITAQLGYPDPALLLVSSGTNHCADICIVWGKIVGLREEARQQIGPHLA